MNILPVLKLSSIQNKLGQARLQEDEKVKTRLSDSIPAFPLQILTIYL